MSIYATQWVLWFPRFGDAHEDCEWVLVLGQGVPAHIGTPAHGYQDGDPYARFLPPPVPMEDNSDTLRAMVIVREDTQKVGQEYIGSLLVLSGEEYNSTSFQQLHDRICDALRGKRPRVIATAHDTNGSRRLLFEDDTDTPNK